MRLPYIILASVLPAIIFIPRQALRAQSQSGSPLQAHLDIEQKAKHADARNRQTIQDLAHEVTTFPHVYPTPEPIASLLESRLTDAEIKFRNNQGHSVSEAQLADLMTWLSDRFKLPAYARTTIPQVRTLRMNLALTSPQFMGSTIGGSGIKKGGHIREEMSPLQAMHLFGLMIDQKILNPDYQDPSIDIVAAERKRKEEMRTKRTGQGGGYIGTQENTKNREMRNSIDSAAEAMSSQDAFDVMNHVFNTLHLN
jgi:hypothetical protein